VDEEEEAIDTVVGEAYERLVNLKKEKWEREVPSRDGKIKAVVEKRMERAAEACTQVQWSTEGASEGDMESETGYVD